MATVAAPSSKLMTAEEFFDFCHRLENRDRHFELYRGEIEEMSLPGERHCTVCGNVTRILGIYTFQVGKGNVCPNDMGLILELDPDTVRGADVTLYMEPRKYDELELKYSKRLPILVVEVLSPNDRAGKVMRRVDLFLKRGIPLIWVIDPEARDITVYQPDRAPAVLDGSDELAGFAVLPDFRCNASDFFALPGE